MTPIDAGAIWLFFGVSLVVVAVRGDDGCEALDPDQPTPGFHYLFTPDLDALRKQLLDDGIEPDEITDGPGPGPNREMCVRDPVRSRP